MLISRRREGDTLMIGDQIEIRIVDVRRNKVILGVIAPDNIKIVAGKLTDMVRENTMAAVHSANIDQFLKPASEQPEPVMSLLRAKKSERHVELADKTPEDPA